jgi:predicted nucleic acid-binding protein
MNMAFADTFLFLAILNDRDAAHEKALTVVEAFPGFVTTTQWVLTEVADAMSAPEDRASFVNFLSGLEADPKFQIIPAADDLFRRGLSLFARRQDKYWSLTDCISFVVMQDRNIVEALTGDQHFRQAAFTTLL